MARSWGTLTNRSWKHLKGDLRLQRPCPPDRDSKTGPSLIQDVGDTIAPDHHEGDPTEAGPPTSTQYQGGRNEE